MSLSYCESEPVMRYFDRAYAALQIADIALYGKDRDIPWGEWEHGATYAIRDLICEYKIIDEIAPHLMRILSIDKSDDVIGRASHLARYLPKEVVAAWPK